MRNIAFIGMPGCGKTTVSKTVAARLGLPWFDSDLEIERAEGKSVARIFAEDGEEYFRRREKEVIAALAEKDGVVFATGGGAPLRNSELIRKNAFVIYLYRDVSGIMRTLRADSRPLLREDPRRLYAMYDERREKYERTCHVRIDNDGRVGAAVRKALEAIYANTDN